MGTQITLNQVLLVGAALFALRYFRWEPKR